MAEIICIMCPKGCRLSVDEESFAVKGAQCARGVEYGAAELKNPTRVLTSTVKITGAAHRRCPVRTRAAIPKAKLFEVMRVLDAIELTAPVREGQVVINDVCGTGVALIAARDM